MILDNLYLLAARYLMGATAGPNRRVMKRYHDIVHLVKETKTIYRK